MTPLRQQMIAALQLSGKSERTQQSYVREVRLLAQFYGKSPHLISESELQQDVLHRKNVDQLAPNSMRICYSGIRFFYLHVLERDWHILDLIRAQSEYRLPAILSVQEVRRLLSWPRPCTTVCTSPPSIAWDSDCTKDSFSKFRTSTANDSWSTCIVARAPRTATSPSPTP